MRGQSLLILEEISKDTGCATSSVKQQLGLQLAETDRAEHHSVAALRQAWRDSADSLVRLVDLLTDGGLLLHHIRLTADGMKLEGTDGRQEVQGVEAQLALVEKPLHRALMQDSGNFLQQVDRAFTMSQLLADSWSTSALATPEAELQDLQAAWDKLQQTVRELMSELRLGSSLRQQLLMRALEAVRGQSLETAFPVPQACDTPGTEQGSMLWRWEEGREKALLVNRRGALMHCDLSTGRVRLESTDTTATLTEVGHHGLTDLGDFLNFLSG
eukprot:TRINITY_DN3401_c0_g6_i1.p1 TRINITY_DN3401_c0_g6~~TRINITY_DN3401_c0_g6_i1.p1  ORF type:complete len:299 (+),score=71.38 TRINITY_DN3401_c0_g6_i1:84-899(+)